MSGRIFVQLRSFYKNAGLFIIILLSRFFFPRFRSNLHFASTWFVPRCGMICINHFALEWCNSKRKILSLLRYNAGMSYFIPRFFNFPFPAFQFRHRVFSEYLYQKFLRPLWARGFWKRRARARRVRASLLLVRATRVYIYSRTKTNSR